ncbi:unnamed protein product [Soboliphyme baturini]|uniref:START domain-containing protein n=1 Tax=Soboliphyme baturini TaxID=241478 RepID=A0A183IQD4_9BILA|nr:unnamed protein product [Soboliphyme baturini]
MLSTGSVISHTTCHQHFVTHDPLVTSRPHSALNEEEWHDAVDAALEKEDLENRRVERLLSNNRSSAKLNSFDRIALSCDHPLYAEIDRITQEQVRYAKLGVSEGVWQLFSEDGEMKMYRRELEIEGLVCDPLKAVHTVKGVTALEFLHYFFEPEYKLDWDTTLEDVHVVETIADDTMVIHQVHKRIWPASQRESLFWSHIRRMDMMADPEAHDLYVVCNHDTVTSKVPVSSVNSKTIRVGLTIAMVCQTFFTEKLVNGFPRSRDSLVCKITYVSQVNPGGWAPSSALRAVYKREYPKFLKRFTNYVLQKIDKTEIRLH